MKTKVYSAGKGDTPRHNLKKYGQGFDKIDWKKVSAQDKHK